MALKSWLVISSCCPHTHTACQLRLPPLPIPPAAAAAAPLDAYQLADLQRYLQQYPPSHYSHGGKEPLLYAVVLLLSLQFGPAVAFLARDAATKDYRLDAVHLAIALLAAGRLPGDDGAAAAAAAGGGDVGALVHRYAKEFVYTDPQVTCLGGGGGGGGWVVWGCTGLCGSNYWCGCAFW